MKPRFVIELEDQLRYSQWFRYLGCEYKRLSPRARQSGDPQAIARSIRQLCDAVRLATNSSKLLAIEQELRERVAQLNGQNIDWREFEPSAEKRRIERATVLKPWISEREKGVLIMSFENQWPRLLHNCDIKEFARRYTLIVSPVWATPHGLVNYVLPAIWPEPVFSTISDPHDAEILPRISPKYIVAPLLCSNWVNPAWFQPVPFEQKDIDIVMLANFGKYKRHHALFNALRDMPPSLKVVLIGTHNGNRSAEVLRNEARAYGVENRFELIQSPADDVVFKACARSKISLILSKREGSCMAIVESMFANTPVGMLEDAEVGSRIFINPATGLFLKDEGLAGQLMDFLAHVQEYSPRHWAEENNISCHGSSARLNQIVKQHMLATGQEWTQDLAVHHWRPNPEIVNAADRQRLQPAFDDIKQRFGMEIGAA